MANVDWTRATKYFLLMDFIKGFGLGMKYFFRAEIDAELPA
jgi:NADH-quinone oxidoreductase subunit I